MKHGLLMTCKSAQYFTELDICIEEVYLLHVCVTQYFNILTLCKLGEVE